MSIAASTLNDGLTRYDIGAKLRRLRLKKSMGLVELGKHTGLSPAMLSKLERNVMHPTLPTLLRIAMVFSVGLEYFFNAEPNPLLEIVRRGDRLRFPDTAGETTPAYFFESLDFPVKNRSLSAYLAEFQALDIAAARPHQHPGIEFVYVISGKLRIRVGGADHLLAEGDAIYFDSSVPHSYARQGGRRTKALVVAAPA